MKRLLTRRTAEATPRAQVGAGIAVLLAALLQSLPAPADGVLVIAGGALAEDNAEVYAAFVDALPEQGRIVVIPVASARPARSAREAGELFTRFGLAEDRILLYPLAVRDDTETPEVDESEWSANAWDVDRVSGMGRVAGYWLTGGDQMRILNTLSKRQTAAGEGHPLEDQDSPLLLAMRETLAAGGVIGGTSAGAAVMSRHMIAGGDGFAALFEPLADYAAESDEDTGGGLVLTRGLGFLPRGIVDQHFDRQARLGRLVRALGETGEPAAFGVDEDTALVVDLTHGRATIRGRGSVTLLDARSAQFDFAASRVASNLKVSVAGSGVHMNMEDFVLDGDLGKGTRGNEYYDHEVQDGGGMALANPRVEQVLGYDLLDNASASRLRRYTVGGDGRMAIYDFGETPESQGYWRAAGSRDRYQVSRVRLDIELSRWRLAGD